MVQALPSPQNNSVSSGVHGRVCAHDTGLMKATIEAVIKMRIAKFPAGRMGLEEEFIRFMTVGFEGEKNVCYKANKKEAEIQERH